MTAKGELLCPSMPVSQISSNLTLSQEALGKSADRYLLSPHEYPIKVLLFLLILSSKSANHHPTELHSSSFA